MGDILAILEELEKEIDDCRKINNGIRNVEDKDETKRIVETVK